MSDRTDEDLVRQFQEEHGRRRQQAFARLFSRHAGMLRGYLRKVTGDHETADDLTQQAFMKALDGLDHFEGRSSFKNWLYKIATNLWKDRLKKKRPSSGIEDYEKLQNITPDELVEKEERHNRVHEAIQELPEKWRAPLMLVRFEDMQYKEAASILDITTDAVRMRVHRAHKALRHQLEDTAFYEKR